jgi:thiamine biosynthesis protein ThiS
LGRLKVDPRAVAVEVNQRILDRAEFTRTTLCDGDAVEIVRMVGGGTTLASMRGLAGKAGSGFRVQVRQIRSGGWDEEEPSSAG